MNSLIVTLRSGSPNHDGKGKMKIVFVFVLFLKALGYFLMPSSFFPE